MKNHRSSAAPAFRLRPLSLALLALFAGPAAAERTSVSADNWDTPTQNDEINYDGYQIGNRYSDGTPEHAIANTTLTLSIATGKTLTFSGVKNGSADPYLGAGGAINVNVPGDAVTLVSPLRFTGGSLVFSNNKSMQYGGVVGARFTGPDQASIFDCRQLASLSFLDNIAGNAGDGNGGGIYSTPSSSSSSVTLGAHALFSDNRAGGGSGSGQGGAIWSGHNVTLHGHTLFENNATGGSGSNGGGAAIWLDGFGSGGTATLDTTVYDGNGAPTGATGAIAFRGNTLADGTANSLHLNQNTQLLLQGDGNLYFDDPISSGTGGNNSLTKTGDGFVQFAGDNRLNTSGISGKSVDTQSGAFRIVSGGSFDASGGSFDASGGSFDASGGGNFNVASGATLAGGGILSPDSNQFEIPGFDYATHTFDAGRNTVAASKEIGTLTLNGNVTLDSATLQMDIDGARHCRHEYMR